MWMGYFAKCGRILHFRVAPRINRTSWNGCFIKGSFSLGLHVITPTIYCAETTCSCSGNGYSPERKLQRSDPQRSGALSPCLVGSYKLATSLSLAIVLIWHFLSPWFIPHQSFCRSSIRAGNFVSHRIEDWPSFGFRHLLQLTSVITSSLVSITCAGTLTLHFLIWSMVAPDHWWRCSSSSVSSCNSSLPFYTLSTQRKE